MNVFSDTQFHEENVISKMLTQIEKTFFVGETKRSLLYGIQPYYDAIKIHSSELNNPQKQQDFLKAVYETFYQAYNQKTADKLGIVYTPSEVVRFMVESANYLLEKHFDKMLSSKGVEILEPSAGTGTFLVEIINSIPNQDLKHKYEHEIFANEISILPYYISNLNIEYAYRQKMKVYKSFQNLSFCDTLDNSDAQAYAGKQLGIFSDGFSENNEKIKRQNSKSISVIIGNPPYNANQQNENDNNKNRTYKDLDKRIKDTFVKESTAQKTKVYDMYARFYRWAMDRIADEGLVAFITNRSFIESKTFDGFRKCANNDFSDIYIVDLKGDIRQNNYKEQGGNVFNIMTGVAIAFFVKNDKIRKTENCKIHYYNV
ncbi:MAG: N-6 DNA methylase, partial [Wohlfahrtiimonas sp.]